MSTGFFDSVTWDVVTGANTSSEKLYLPPGGRLLYVGIGGSSGDGAVRTLVDLYPGQTAIGVPIVSGWNRSPTDISGGQAVTKVVDIELSLRRPFVIGRARNDTGATVSMRLSVIAERP